MTMDIETPAIQRELTTEEIAEREAWDAGSYEREVASIEAQRKAAYLSESDYLRDYYLRGENGVTLEDWKAKVDEIRERFPYPEQPS